MNISHEIMSYIAKNARESTTNHHPSECLQCLRSLYYRRLNVPESNPNKEHDLIKMHIGNMLHDGINKILNEKYTMIFERAYTFSHPELKYDISARVDAIDYATNVGYEYKTVYGYGVDETIVNGNPKEDHIAQIAIYLHTNPWSIKQFELYYLDRGNGLQVQYSYNIENEKLKELYKTAINNFKKLEEYLKENKFPERQYKVIIQNGIVWENTVTRDKVKYKSDWHCTYCKHKDHCWAEELKKYEGKDNIEEFVTNAKQTI